MTDEFSISVAVPSVVSSLDASLVSRAAAAAAAPPRAAATDRAHAGDWGRFEGWCAAHGLVAMPTDEATICTYLVHLSDEGNRHSTIARAYASIRAVHRQAGQPFETLERAGNVLASIARERGTAPVRKAPLTVDVLRRIVRASADGLTGIRDRALILLCFSAALRRSELVALDIADVRETADGLEVNVRRGKTDQLGAGRVVGVPFGRKETCPVRALRAWLKASGIASGPIFRSIDRHGNLSPERLSAQSVALVVKRACDTAGIQGDFAGHSLRAGFVTSAAKAGKGLDAIMRQTGHRSERIARGYIRHATVFENNAAEGLL